MSVNKNLLSVLPDETVLNSCIHCGLCLSVCPTYEMTKNERSSPRGRISLIKSAAKGDIEITKLFAEEMDFCLDCQACMTACPAGVQYGIMVESARVETSRVGHTSFLRKYILKYIIPNKTILSIAILLLNFYNRSGLQKFFTGTGILKFISKDLPEIQKLSPSVIGKSGTRLLKDYYGNKEVIAPVSNVIKYKTAFHSGCIMDVMFGDINKDTVDLLSKTGCSVYIPNGQICCGSLHAHNGDFDTAKKLARKNIDAFEADKYDWLVSNSAGCGAFMKEYKLFLKDDPVYRSKAIVFSSKVKDVTEFFAEREDVKYRDTSDEITYHDACHLVHSQKVFNDPRKVFSSIPGLKVHELEESTWCCGSAGIYNVVRYQDSLRILERKMKNLALNKSSIVVTGNPGCMAQLKYGSEKFNVNKKVIHTATFLLNQVIDDEIKT